MPPPRPWFSEPIPFFRLAARPRSACRSGRRNVRVETLSALRRAGDRARPGAGRAAIVPATGALLGLHAGGTLAECLGCTGFQGGWVF